MMNRIPLYLFIFFCMLTFAGILLGEPTEVFNKAVSICLSCIGIG